MSSRSFRTESFSKWELLIISVLLMLLLTVLFREEAAKRFDRDTVFSGIRVTTDEEGIYVCAVQDSEDPSLWEIFLPAGMRPEGSYISFDGDLTLMIGDQVYETGDRLKEFFEGEHLTAVFRRGRNEIVRGFLRFHVTKNTPTIMIDMRSPRAFEEIRADREKKTERAANIRTWNADLEMDCETQCTVSGRGNATWRTVETKKGYKLSLETDTSLLGLRAAEKWTLLANYFDDTYLRNRIAFETARVLGCEETPDDAFVNLYVDGKYQGLYQLTQKVDMAGGIMSAKTGTACLLEFNTEGWENEDDLSFYTHMKLVSLIYPKKIREEEKQDLINDLKSAEVAMQQANDAYTSYLDEDSFVKHFLIHEVYLNKDVDFSSQFIYRNSTDSRWKAGPIWDFDRSFGAPEYKLSYNGIETRVSWIEGMTRDGNVMSGWYKALSDNPIFMEHVREYYGKCFSHVMENIEREWIPKWMEEIYASVEMDHSLYDVPIEDYDEACAALREWMSERRDFTDRLWIENESFIRITFYTRHDEDNAHDLIYHCKPGEKVLNFPYGSTIVGWKDEEGNSCGAGMIFDGDTVLFPIHEDDS